MEKTVNTMRQKTINHLLAGCGLWLALAGATLPAEAASVKIAQPQCEYLTDPLGLDVGQPRLSWKLEATSAKARSQRQTACQILVASSRKNLAQNKGDLWDSGVLHTDTSINVPYAGKALASGQRCYWKVRVQDERGEWTKWSEPASWSMGLLKPEDWKGQWIGSGEVFALDKSTPRNNTTPDPWLRKTFTLPEKPASAQICVASIGYHELYVNSRKVSDAVLAPAATDYKHRARYVTYDIAAYLEPGTNVIALWLGSGWAVYPNYQTPDKPRAPIVLAQADIRLSKGAKITIATDATWKTHPSPNTMLGVWEFTNYGGELYDANKELPEWCDATFNDTKWKAVTVYHPKVTLSAEKNQPNKLITLLNAVAIESPTNGVWRIDMGSNYAGWIEMDLQGQPGDRIDFKFSERPNREFMHNLHSAYIIGPSGKGTFRNRFNYSSGRWITITGLRGKPQLKDIHGWLVHTAYPRTGGFECDQPLLNRIYNTTLWTFENLSLGCYVVDCPQRERMGYGGDAHATTRTALNNYDLAAFYSKWTEDWRDVQGPDGNLPYTAPTYWGGGGPGWSGYCITLPWELYRRYGDVQILDQNFPTMQRWLAFLETKSTNNMLARWGGDWDFLGDWLWPGSQQVVNGGTRETLFYNNCYWIYNLLTAARAAEVLGQTNVATTYRQRADQVRQAVHATFFNPADASYVNGFPAYLAVALLVDLPPQELRPAVWKRLEKEILEVHKGHIHAGITGGAFLFKTLLENNRNDLIYTMVRQEEFPGWGQMLKDGATTFYEDWEHVESSLHSSYLYVGSWFNEGLGGIQHPDAGGFKNFVIHPWIDPDNGPRSTRAHYDSPYGRIESEWKVTGSQVNLHITVPPNTRATLKLDKLPALLMSESGKPLNQSLGITVREGNPTSTLLTLDPGRYEFQGRFQ
jgi:alpha-L-rhamnosidase